MPRARELLVRLESADYVIAPIAGNRMFQIIDEFAAGEITDAQCEHALFMRSEEPWRVDTTGSFDNGTSVDDVIRTVHAEYGGTSYGSELYPSEVLYWMGYVYRYWCIDYGWSSRRAHALCGAREMRELYYAYHTLDPGQCVERILESKGEIVLSTAERDMELDRRGIEALRRIRAASGEGR